MNSLYVQEHGLTVRFDEFYGPPNDLARSRIIVKHIEAVLPFGVIAEVSRFQRKEDNR